MKRLGLGIVATVSILFGSMASFASEAVVIVETTGVRDEAHLKEAIGRELGATVIAKSDGRAKDAGTLSIEAANKTLTVTFRKAGQGDVVRSVALPATDARIESSAVLLAGNVARDEANDVLRGIEKKKAQVAAPKLLLPPPTPEQVNALGVLRDSVGAYEKGAKEYRETVASIVKLHYEVKKSAVLSGLDREIALEKAELEKARDTAIRRLEELIQKHPGVSPVTPDAMYRLAALYEERERRADAIAMYQRIIKEFPSYRELAGVHYFLGHALNDDGRIREAQTVWRTLVSISSDPKYVAETWWQIGNYEFDLQGDPRSLNRAASAYQAAIAFKRPPIHAVALYKYAWTLFKQQRYELATKTFVTLLEKTSEVDFRNEACAYIAASLANLDFVGPAEDEPYAFRPDILDSEPNLERAEKKLHVAIDRLKDPALIPQDKPWTIEIYRALGRELASLNQFSNALEVHESMLSKWPMDPSAPDTQSATADTYDQIAITKKLGSPEHAAAARSALDARTKLAGYVGSTPWVDANKDNPPAIRHAESLVRHGLRYVAAQHTNNARSFLNALGSSSSKNAEQLERAIGEYKLAIVAWDAYAKQDSDGPDAYENRYWAADARHKYVGLQMKLHQSAPVKYPEPTKKEIDEAVLAAIEVRDSREDDRFIDNAAFFAVDLADVERDLAYEHHANAKGAAAGIGIEKRDDVKFRDPAQQAGVVRDPIPSVVRQSMAARDEYVRVVSVAHANERDVQARSAAYRYWVAETFFLYGHWDQARERLDAIWRDRCGVDAYGTKAWQRLVTMAAKERDDARALALSDAVDPTKGGKSCDAAAETQLAGPLRHEALLQKARRLFEATCEAPIGQACKNPSPNKKAAWREVAAMYERALESQTPQGASTAARAGDDAQDEAAMNAAFASKQAGDTERATQTYERLIATTSSPQAYEALATTYYAAFDYPNAAATFLREANDPKVDLSHRRDAARNALILDAGLGRKASAVAAHGVLSTLKPDAATQAEADFRVAVLVDRGTPAKIVVAWDRLKATNATLANQSPFVDYAAEAAFTIVDQEIATKLDDPALHRYGATSAEIIGDPTTHKPGKYQRNGAEAARLDLRLRKEVIEKYPSATWVAVAYARQGALFDTLRSGLYDAVKVKTTTAQMDAVIGALRSGGKDDQADRLEDAARDLWLGRKRIELDAADDLMIARYAIAAALAKQHGIARPEISKALGRLAYFTDVLGDAKLGNIVSKTPDPADPKGTTKLGYTSKMYVVGRPGLTSPVPPANAKPNVLAP